MKILFSCHGNIIIIYLFIYFFLNLNDSSTKTTVSSVVNCITANEESIKLRVPFSNLLFLKEIFFMLIIFPCPSVVYMYKIMISLNNSSESTKPISTKFHIDPTSTVEM